MIGLAAGITAISMTLGSYHLNREVPHNEVNPGLIVESGNYVAGLYYNSHWKYTALLGYHLPLVKVGSVNFGVIGAACTGYSTPVCGGITIRYGNLQLLLAPPTSDTSGVVGLSFRKEIK